MTARTEEKSRAANKSFMTSFAFGIVNTCLPVTAYTRVFGARAPARKWSAATWKAKYPTQEAA